MWHFVGSLWAADTADSLKDTARRAGSTISAAVTPVVIPVVNAAVTTSQTLQNWIHPLPAPTESQSIMWKRQTTYFPFVNNSRALYALFEIPSERAKINQKHVFCALHHPGLALDLCVLFNIPLDAEHEHYVYNHYINSDWSGAARDRLFTNLCNLIENRTQEPAPNQSYEIFIRNTLYNRSSLLYRVLDNHRYTYSPAAFTGKPDTLTMLNDMLRDKQANRLRRQTN